MHPGKSKSSEANNKDSRADDKGPDNEYKKDEKCQSAQEFYELAFISQ